MDSVIGQIVSMGYDQELAQKCFNATKSTDLNTNIEWIEKHLEQEAIKESLKGTEEGQQHQEQQPAEDKQKEESKENKPEGEQQKWGPISHLVDPLMVAQLQDMGFSKNVAEKAIFMTQDQKSLEAALAWTEKHQGDADYEEQLLMQISDESNKPKLSEAEARQKARELQQKLREERQKREAQEEIDKEKRRIMSGKNMGDAQREIQELKKRQDALQLKQQREQDAIDKQRMLEQLQRDREERFGKKFAGNKPADQQAKEPTPFEKFQVGIKQVKTAHPRNIFLDKAQVCLKTIQIYIQNMVNNPTEEKFRKINLENKAYQTRVGECFGAKETLLYLGFVEEGTFLVNHNPNFEILKQALTFLEKEISTS
ncbi:hypothetical protein ABPG74_003026 [Tetrahymena malaccensis]